MNKEYDDIIHRFLEIKMRTSSAAKAITFINDVDNESIKEQLFLINDIIDENNMIYTKLFDEPYESLFNSSLQIQKLQINKIQPIRTKHYYTLVNDKQLYNTYQCYLKSSIYFFLNNKHFINHIIEQPKQESLSIFDTDKYLGGDASDVIRDSLDDIDNILVNVKQYLNSIYNNKYILSIPGVKVYPSIVINDIIKDCKFFSQYCYYETDEENGFIIDIPKHYHKTIMSPIFNAVYETIINIKDTNTIRQKLLTLNEDILKKLTYPQLINIQSTIPHLIHYPEDLLLHCPLYDPHEIYMINNVHKLIQNSRIPVSYKMIKNIFNHLVNSIDTSVFYPNTITIDNNNYRLHSFIICNTVHNQFANFDTHFVYYKMSNKSVVRLDGDKKRIVHEINKRNKYYDELKILTKDGVKDNANTRVCFVCYRKF